LRIIFKSGGFMKKLLTLAFAAGLSLSLFAADIFTYVPMTGSVKSYTKTDFSIASRFGTLYRTPSSKVIHYFDSTGKESSSSELTPKDAIINSITSSYDANGNLTERTCTNNDGEVVWKNTSEYKNGLKADSSEFDRKGNLKARTIYSYENKMLVDESSYDEEGALIWKTIYKYDENGRIASISEYNPDGSLSERDTYSYTDTGLIDTIAKIDTDKEKESQLVFRYGSNGALNEITTYDNLKQVIKRTIIKYDDNGNVNKVSEYDVAEKFGTTVNELVAMTEYDFDYSGAGSADSK